MQAVKNEPQVELNQSQETILVQVTDMAPSPEPKTVATVEVTINKGMVLEGIKVLTDGARNWTVVLPATALAKELQRTLFARFPKLREAIDQLIFRELVMEHHEWCHGPMEAYFYGRSQRGQIIVSTR